MPLFARVACFSNSHSRAARTQSSTSDTPQPAPLPNAACLFTLSCSSTYSALSLLLPTSLLRSNTHAIAGVCLAPGFDTLSLTHTHHNAHICYM